MSTNHLTSPPIDARRRAPTLAISRRTRSTPYSSRVEAYGVASYTVYNHMLLPAQIHGLEDDYQHLRDGVQLWDVSCERQVEVHGPDASRLAQLLTVRDLRAFVDGRCGYAPVLDHQGHVINDPVVLKLADDRYWFSIADSDVELWAAGLAHGMGLDVDVSEPDVWPLAVQGRLADDVVAAVFGDEARAIRFFRFAVLPFHGHPLVVARSGWSAQGGFEIYVDDAEVGGELYDALTDSGAAHGIRPGCPNLIERIEAGLLSYGTDITRADTALEAGLDRYCALDAPIEAIGLDALRAQAAVGVSRRICGLTIDGDRVPPQRDPWTVTSAGGQPAGSVTSAAWSPRLQTNVAIGMIDIASTADGSPLVVACLDGDRTATVATLPFPGASNR